MKKNSALIYTSSGLGLVPLPRCPNYSASKAALHHFLICLRLHLKETSVRVMEIFPPAVQTELLVSYIAFLLGYLLTIRRHDETYQPGEHSRRCLPHWLLIISSQISKTVISLVCPWKISLRRLGRNSTGACQTTNTRFRCQKIGTHLSNQQGERGWSICP